MSTSVRPVGSARPAVPVALPRARRRRPGPVPAWWRDASAGAAWAAVLATVTLWVHDGGVTGVPTDPMTSFGRLTGLLASVLMLLQVAILARIPWVEQAWGQDGLARTHRWVGFGSFWLMVAHVVMITVGYAGGWAGAAAELVSLVLVLPGILLAVAGTASVVMVVVTSVRAARRRLRYESWHLLHLYAYLGVGLALPHQLWTGEAFTSSAPARAFWWGLYAVVAGLVLIFRLALPAWRAVRHPLRVSAVEPAGPGATSVYVSGRGVADLPVRAGQFFVWRFLDGPGWTRGKPFSLSAAPTADTLRFTAEHVGQGSLRTAGLRPGTRVVLEGPFGRLHEGVRTRRKVLLLGSGIGIAPLRALLEDLEQAPGEVTVVHRASDRDTALLREELAQLARDRGATYVLLDGPRAGDGRVAPAAYAHLSDHELFLQLVPDVADHEVYLCGSPGFMAAAQALLADLGVPPQSVHAELFAY
ncbi:MAG: oxidoreductase [Acidobacteria bacterium]|nr:MAG: oxidoreductase [Acidobacteriota bacterium]